MPSADHTSQSNEVSEVSVASYDHIGAMKPLQKAADGEEKIRQDLELAPTTSKQPTYPEGGFRAWMVVAGASMVMAMSFGMVNSFGVYQTYYEHEYPSVTSTKISLIGSIQAGFTFLFGIPSTIGMYYLGPQVMVAIGGLLCILSYMFLSISNAVWQLFVIQGVMCGIGSGTMYIHSTGVTFQYFHKRKALVQGLITAGASCAGVYWPIGVRGLINKLGFGWGNRIIGFIYIPMTVFAVLFLRPRWKAPKRKPDENVLRLRFNVLKKWRLLLLCLAWFLNILALFPGLFYIDLFCARLGVSQPLQDYNVAIVNACSLFARVIPGYFGDYFGRINFSIIFLLVSGILPLALWTNARSTGSTLAFCITWGVASGAPVSLLPSVVGQLFSAKDIPSCLAFFYACGGIASLVGPTIGGSFIPKGRVSGPAGFNKLAIFVGVISLASCACIVLLRLSYTRKIFYII